MAEEPPDEEGTKAGRAGGIRRRLPLASSSFQYRPDCCDIPDPARAGVKRHDVRRAGGAVVDSDVVSLPPKPSCKAYSLWQAQRLSS